jgi:hypothetical protein
MKVLTILALVFSIYTMVLVTSLLVDVAGIRQQLKTHIPQAASTTPEKAPTGADLPRTPEELPWVRQVVEGYLTRAKGEFYSGETLAWLSDAYRNRMEKGSQFWYYQFQSWDIKSLELSPALNEAIAVGTVQATRYGTYKPGSGGGDQKYEGTVPFRLRVAKSTDGKWQIDSMQFEAKPE